MILGRLKAAADSLDQLGRYAEADALDSVLRRLAYMPNEFNAPIDGVRVIDYKRDVEKDSEELDEARNKFPRYQPKPFISLPGSDDPERGESIFGLNNEGESSGISHMMWDSYSAGMHPGNTKDFEWDTSRKDNPWHNLPAH